MLEPCEHREHREHSNATGPGADSVPVCTTPGAGGTLTLPATTAGGSSTTLGRDREWLSEVPPDKLGYEEARGGGY